MKNNNWIFLRGLARGNIHWGDFPTIFKKHNPTANMEFLEIPGNGTFNQVNTPINAKEVIHLIRLQSKFTEENAAINICGVSLGGMLALKWAELYPQNINSVTVINTSLSQYSSFNARLKPGNYIQLTELLLKSDYVELERMILQITSNQYAETQKYISMFANFSETHPVSRLNFMRQLILANKIEINCFPKVDLTIICSRSDRLVDYSCSSKIAEYLGGKLCIHPTAGHDIPLDDPEWLCNMLGHAINPRRDPL